MATFKPRKRIRSAPDVCDEPGRAFSVTIATRDRSDVFSDPALAGACIDQLRALRERKGNPVFAYCLMPNHAHVLVGVVPGSPLGPWVATWTSPCDRQRRQLGLPDPSWQRGSFDHALRDGEDLRAAALYILRNPVRADLVTDFHSYPACGSLEFAL